MNEGDSEKILVKLYELNDQNSWKDKCTGYLFLYVLESDDSQTPVYQFVIAKDPEADDVLHQFDLDSKACYELQQETLISWESENQEYALSFQTPSACQITYETIVKSIKVLNGESLESNLINSDLSGSKNDDVELPTLSHEHLKAYAQLFVDMQSNIAFRDKLVQMIDTCNFFQNLVKLFRDCEDLDDQEGLKYIYEIIKGTLSMARFSTFESLLTGDNLLEIIGMLEYNPHKPQRIEHRKLLESSKFSEIIPFTNPELRELIVQTHRLQYLHDLLLPTPVLFDDRIAYIASILLFRKTEIMESIFEDKNFLSELFGNLGKEATGPSVKENLLKLINEMCNFSKLIHFEQKKAYMDKLLDFDVIHTIDSLKELPGDTVANCILEVLFRIAEANTETVREGFIAAVERKSNLFIYLCDKLLEEPNSSVSILALQIFNVLLDSSNSSSPTRKVSNNQDAFLVKFYSEPMDYLMKPFLEYAKSLPLTENSYTLALTIESIFEVLLICLVHHTYHIKNYIFRNDLLRYVGNLIFSKYVFISHWCVKIMRHVILISISDKFFAANVLKESILDKLLDALMYKFTENNLINSSLLDFFEFLIMSGNQKLIVDLVSRRRTDLQKITYVSTFKKLIEQGDRVEEEKHSKLKSAFLIRPNELFTKVDNSGPSNWDRENIWFETEENEVVEGANETINVKPDFSTPFDIDLPPLKSRFNLNDDNIVLRPKLVKNSIFVSLKRRNSKSPEHEPQIGPDKNDKLVDYSDDDNEDSLRPNEDYIAQSNEVTDIPSIKKSKPVESS
ncbi:Serine/threonine-protein phosphatase 4 regulatory subunit 3 [Thelohanellus kitauei]|uniref:Serine/threonine-protein phosphatase 4 regulatory subunit 3 n=1 Tax=Thelohanellus kitauei TaxID=669202 RepID=A0A0C2JUJ3_THEKT|nr:Serine/threonine-protein phosphatase 4 regulatory subunit 3 [Thelohanellus kitauei]